MEKAPRKKEKKPLRPRTLLLLMLCAAALAGAGLALLRHAPVILPERISTEKVLLLSRPGEEVASVAIAPREGAAYPLIRKGDTFVLAGEEDVKLRQSALDDMLLSLTELPAESVVLEDLSAEAALSPEVFGLSPARAVVTVTYSDGEKKKLLLGNRAPDDEKPQWYCMVEGDPRLFTVLEADGSAFLHEMEYMRDFAQPGINAGLLDRIEITGGKTVIFSYTPDGWRMEAPYRYPAAAVRMDALLSRIESMGFAALLGREEQVDLEALGLENPGITVKLTQAASVITGETAGGEQVTLPVPEKEYTLRIGGETGQSGVYVSWQGQVYKASNFLLGFWKDLDPEDYLLKTPVNLLVNQLSEVSFSAGGKTGTYEVRMVESVTENNRIAADEYGHTLYDCAVRRGGETRDMDAEAFLSWYTRLAGLSAEGRLPDGYKPTGESRGRIVIKSETAERVIAFYPYDALHDTLAVDGQALFYVQKSWLDSVTDLP